MKRRMYSSIWAKVISGMAACLIFSGCFLFYDGSLDGFWIDGIYDGSTKLTLCSDEEVRSWLQWSDQSFERLDGDSRYGSLRYTINRACFSDDTSSGCNSFAFVSPPLTTWDDVTGYNFRVKASIATRYFTDDIYVQPTLEIEKADGSTVFEFMTEEDEDGFDVPIKFNVPNDGHWYTFTFERAAIQPGDTVAGLSILVRIPDEVIAALEWDETASGIFSPSSFVFLDFVEPLRP